MKRINKEEPKGYYLFEVTLYLIINSISLMLASKVFTGIYISTIWYALLASIIIVLLNKTIKPILVFLTLPVTVLSLGLFYPFINVMVLKMTSSLIGLNFIIEGWLAPFFIAIFISVMNLLLESVIVKPILESR